MNEITLSDINILDIGNTIQIAGTVWAGNGMCFITPGPNSIEDFSNIQILKMDLADWQKFIRQADLLETEIIGQDSTGITKMIYRKSQRQIDTVMQWVVFQRDNYTCRYCGRTGLPLTVDHIDLWEHLGVTIPENLLSACKKCNKDRGNLEYQDWLNSEVYKQRSLNLSSEIKQANLDIVAKLPELIKLRVKNIRSR